MEHPTGLTADQVAAMMNVRVAHIYALCRADIIPHYYVGRLIRFEEDKVLAWIAQGGARTRRQPSPTEPSLQMRMVM
jgi:excisionase family DNA binding protein